MNSIKDLIEKIINPPGLLKKNRRALFDTIRDIGELIKKDALTAFNAHFPYLADAKKLQEHGDALLIPHLLHDTETAYRERVAAASFFLMKAGERQYIMGQLEERFKTRYLIHEAFLDVHLKVADLTDDERAWALDLLDSLLNPVIATELSEWFHYLDNVMMSDDSAVYHAERHDIDLFDDPILRDGRILRDGKTAFDKTIKVYRNGLWKRIGRYGRSGSYTFPETDITRGDRGNSKIFRDERRSYAETITIRRDGVLKRDGRHKRFRFYSAPATEIRRIYYGSAYRDPLLTAIKAPMEDGHVGSPPRDGMRPRDGSSLRGYMVAFEELSPFYTAHYGIEDVPTEDRYAARVFKPLLDTHKTGVLRDGSGLRTGVLQRGNMVDDSSLTFRKPLIETARHKLWRNGVAKRDGSEDRSGLAKESMGEKRGETYTVTPFIEQAPSNETAQALVSNKYRETHTASIRRDGTFRRNGLLQRANIQDTSEMNYQTATVTETAHYRVFRNGMAKRDGTEPRSGFGLAGIYEDGRAVIMFPVEKDVIEGRDAGFQSAFSNNALDMFKNVRKRDGLLPRNGLTHRSNGMVDLSGIMCEMTAMRETAIIEELLIVGTRKHLRRAGMYVRNGSVLRNNNVLVRLAE